MTDFWLYSVLLILVGMLFILWPVWKMRRQHSVDRTALNVALYEERIAELGAQKAAGEITAELHDIALEEAGKLLLEDTAKADQARRPTHRGGPWPIIVSAGVLPLIVIALYMSWGNPAGVELLREMEAEPVPADLVAYIDRMERVTQVQPENGEVWYMLGRAYLMEQRPTEAADAFGNAVARLGEIPEILAQLAQARFFANGNQLDSEAQAALERALELNPREPTALGLFGIASFEAGEYQQAISYWERLKAGMPPDSSGFQAIQGGIDRARERLGEAAETEQSEQPQISLRLELSDELAEQYGDDAIVFISARDPNGPPMPLFAQRLAKTSLPLQVTLNSSHALMPGVTMQPGQSLQLTARISPSSDVSQATHQAEPVEVTVGEEGEIVLRIAQPL
ncbi:MAG: c-type cytochrome biogenesis protein CcmI [Gammaproteobacteria bacterium]|nr:c-type cytochrome biogenesis protein CcmI [Gammaproteobacteria bacterium]